MARRSLRTLRSSRTRQTQRSSPTLRNFHIGELSAPRSVSLGLLGDKQGHGPVFVVVKDAREPWVCGNDLVRPHGQEGLDSGEVLALEVRDRTGGGRFAKELVPPHSVEGLLFRDLPTDGRASNGSPLSKAGRQQRHRQRRSRQPLLCSYLQSFVFP